MIHPTILTHSHVKEVSPEILGDIRILPSPLTLKTVTTAAFLIAILFITSCTDKKASAQQSPGAAPKSDVKPPDMDIHSAVLMENLVALKQHIAAGTDLNTKDPFGGSSPLITAGCFWQDRDGKSPY